MSKKSILKISNTLLVFALLLSTTSCLRIAVRTYLGIDPTPEWLETEDIEKLSLKYLIPLEQSYVLDTISYRQALIANYKTKAKALKKNDVILAQDSVQYKQYYATLKNDLQPVQVRYFKPNGEPIFKMISCYVEGLIPTQWNVQGCFDEFPPKPLSELKKDEDITLQEIIPHIKSLKGNGLEFSQLPKADYYAVVFWNKYFVRPSKNILNQIRAYDKKFDNQDTYFIFINNQGAQLWPLLTDESRRELKEELKNS